MTADNSDQDLILIIGAGSAGISAARYFQQAGQSFKVIEASHRIGGRAYSEPYKSGGWFDLGCSYLHEGEINPLVPMALDAGFRLGDGKRFHTENWFMQQDGAGANAEVLKGYEAFDENLHQQMTAYQDAAIGDVSLADIMDFSSPYAAVHIMLQAGLNASDANEQSVADHLNVNEGLDYPVLGGLGRLVQQLAADIPVELNCRAEKITYGKGGVRVQTNKGEISASKVIMTVSTGIMNSGAIEFIPALPAAHTEAFQKLKCGTLNKIGFALDQAAAAELADGWHVNFPGPHSPPDQVDTIATVDMVQGEYPQAVVFAGGSFGEYLEKQGLAAMKDFGERCLVDLFGGSIKAHITDHICTSWQTEPLTLGSYSYAVPGGSPARQMLAEAVDGQIYFAGEAISKHHYGTCHGAYLSGLRAAKASVNTAD